MREFGINIKGRVRNFSLPENKSLIPLFEAVVNSLQAIEERQKSDSFEGKILIKIDREETLSEDILGKIDNITITDNGIGFDEKNFTSFLESDSEYKRELGGKGVGRFSWLKAFERVNVDSCFSENKTFYRRVFDFSLNNEGVDDELMRCECEDYTTSVKLCAFLDKYKAHAPVRLDVIAIKLIQHCFVYFLNNNCPKIILSDNKSNVLNLNEIFKDEVALEDGTDTFSILDNQFKLTKIRVGGDIINCHK